MNYRHPGGSCCRSARAAQPAGLALGLALAGLPTEVVGVLVNDRTPMGQAQIRRLAAGTGRLLRRAGAAMPDGTPLAPLTVRHDWLGPGYGVPTAESAAADWLAEHTGLRAEPVYTAKAAAALRALTADGTPDGPVLYWHTADRGGTPDAAGSNPLAS